MTRSTADVDASPTDVFAVVADPCTYPDWLLGAHRIRGVDGDWPAAGSAFRHLIGVAPFVVPGSTTVISCDEPHRLELRAGMGPFGAAEVAIEVEQRTGGSRVSVDERFVAGPARWAWRAAHPVVAALVWGRNAVSLDALDGLVAAEPVAPGRDDR